MTDLETIGRYEVERRLGHGAFATVWLARDLDLDARVAIKVLSDNWLHDRDVRDRFIREARVLRLLDDQRIVRVYTVDRLDDGRPFFVMEYADGGNLRERLETGGRKNTFSMLESVQLSREIARGLAAAHALGVVHRDLKPSNVLFKTVAPYSRGTIANGDNGERLLLGDFGIAEDMWTGKGGPAAGTFGYMAPEQSNGDVSPMSDIYAAGVVLAELLVGGGGPIRIDVHNNDIARQLAGLVGNDQNVPPQLLEVLAKALQPQPELRFETALAWDEALGEVARALVEPALTEGRSIESSGIGVSERFGGRATGEPSLPPTNLPRQLTRFVGRRLELMELEDLVVDRPLVTVTGAGGVGKSRLVYQTAANLQPRFPAGVWVMEFAPLLDPMVVPHAIAQVLGVAEEPDRTLTTALVEHLEHAEMLLVFDNCEHVLEAVATVASELATRCPGVHIVSTSREALGVAGEAVRPLSGLDTLRTTRDVELGEILTYDAVALFALRAREAKFNFELTDSNALAVAQICETLDGVPLAIELAAARLRHTTIQVILEGLDDLLALLRSQSRTALPHHRTLGAAIDWSYDTLDRDEQRLLRWLAVFVGGFNLASVHGVCGAGMEKIEMLDLVGRLIDKSMVQVVSSNQVSRYTLLEPIRQYAWEKLDTADELIEAVHNHRSYFVTFVTSISKPANPVTQEAYALLELELENLVAATSRSVSDGHFSEAADLITSTERLYARNGRFDVGERQIRSILENAEMLTPLQHAEVLLTGAWLAGNVGRFAESTAWSEKVLELSSLLEPSDQYLVGIAMNNAGLNRAYHRGEYEQAWKICKESLDRTPVDSDSAGFPMSSLGEIAYLTGDLDAAESWFQQSIEKSPEWQDLVVFSLAWLARINLLTGDVGAATRYIESASLTAFESQQHIWDAEIAAIEANLAVRESSLGIAAERFQASFRLFQDNHATQGIAELLTDYAGLIRQLGRADEAASLLGAASAWRDRNQQRLHPVNQTAWLELIEELRSSLGQTAFDNAWAAGTLMSNAETLAYVISDNVDDQWTVEPAASQ